jgi:membrane protease YdiL (CAAX protease family)
VPVSPPSAPHWAARADLNGGSLPDNAARAPDSVEWRAVGTYVALAYTIAWLVEGIALANGVRFAHLTIGATALLASVMFTPALAALIVRALRKEGFASAGLRFGPLRLYAAVWLGVPLLAGLIYAITIACGLGTFDPSVSRLTELLRTYSGGRPLPALPPMRVLALLMFLQSISLGLIITTIATFGEELGWTGYLLVKLLPLGRWRAALLYGVIWGLWHAPVIVGGFNYPGYPVLGVVMMCLLTTALALGQTALRLRSNSVLLTSFAHACVNAQGLGVLPLFFLGVSPILGGITGVVGIGVFGVVGAWLLAATDVARVQGRAR